MKKLLLIILSLFLIQNLVFAKDVLQFKFPNEGWHKVDSPDKVQSKKCYVPYNQSSENYTEMFIFSERVLQNKALSPMAILQKQLGKDKNNYLDVMPRYIKQDIDDAMVYWCSESKTTCAIERAFQGKEGVILVIYKNKMPHYSQNLLTNQVNIVGSVKTYSPNSSQNTSDNLIEL